MASLLSSLVSDHTYSDSSAASDAGSGSSATTVEHHQQRSHRPPPSLILDSSCPLVTRQTPKSLSELLIQLQTSLPISLSALDTSPMLPAGKPGMTEVLLGNTQVIEQGLVVDTKVKVLGSSLGAGKAELKAGLVRESLRGSLSRLRVGKVRVLYAQRPDSEVPLGEIAGGFGGMVSEGLCESWGIRNFPASTLRDLLKCCERRHYKKPGVFQGEYNVLSRRNEKIFPILRSHSMVFHAYDPTAHGFLVGQKAAASGPSSNQSTAWKGTHDNPVMHDALDRITMAGHKHGIPPLSAGLRWLAYHSDLGEEDGIILGACTYEELDEKVREIAKGPLPEEMVGLMEDVRIKLRDGTPRG